MTRIRRRLALLGALLVTAIFGVAALLMATQRADGLSESQQATDNFAQVVAEQTSRTLQPVDLTLREIQGRLTKAISEGADTATDPRSRAVFELLVERLKALPQVDALILVGPDGQVANFSRGFPASRLDASQRDYYQYFSTHDDHALFVSSPVKTFLADKWTVFLARRINDPRGAFAGVILATVTLPYLEDFYRAVTPNSSAIALFRRDGTMLARYPALPEQVGTKLPAAAPWYKLLGENGGSYRTPGYIGTTPSLVSVRPLRDFPLVINVLLSETAALAQWRSQVVWLLAGAIFAASCVTILLWTFGMQYSRLTGQNIELRTARQRFDAVLDNMSQGLTFFDVDQKLMICNRRFADIYNLLPDQVRPGTSLSEIVSHRVANGSFPDMTGADYLARRNDFARIAKSFAITDEFRDGRVVSMNYQPLPGGGWVVTHEEITERRRAEATLAFMARHDALTGLPNRTLFQERLTDAITMTRWGGHCALMCLDLDRFKVINDTLGHLVGDGLLRAVAARLLKNLRDGDTLARLGGDEFAIILADMKSPEDAAHLVERIILEFAEPYEVDGHRIIAATSVGLSVAPRDGTEPDALMKNADIALYLAKVEGRGTYRFFEPEIDSHIHRRRVFELDLRNALPAEDFVLHYQPILDLDTGMVSGFEALIRWQHPVKGMISPADFIPIAEETGLIVQLGAWVLKTACIEAAAWPSGIEIAVNLSPAQFRRGQLLETVQQALAVSGLAPNRLELEITESTLLQNSNDTLAVLHQLRSFGVRIALDDFGTGYSSLSYLRSFPFDKIKIDQCFVRNVATDTGSAAIVGAIVGLARSLQMTTVAEGVETPQQLAMVSEQGCAKVQGYLFSRPCPAAEVPALIRDLRVSGSNAGVSKASAAKADEVPRSLITSALGANTARGALETIFTS